MRYSNGLDREGFLQHLADEFPLVFMNSFSREIVENVVDYCLEDNFTHSKNARYYFLMDMIPEITPGDLIPYMDPYTLTNEVLSLMDDVEELLEAVDGPVVVRTLDELRVYLHESGWRVWGCSLAGLGVGWDIDGYSPAGFDFVFTIQHDNDVVKAVQALRRYAYDFDVDEHVQLNLGGRDAPSATVLAQDAEAIQAMLMRLVDGVALDKQLEIGETIEAAKERGDSCIHGTTITHKLDF